jgi:hypothetical protein
MERISRQRERDPRTAVGEDRFRVPHQGSS